MLKLAFLDFDGVINKHKRLPSEYCGTDLHLVKNVNELLDTSGAEIVISSSWRYMIYCNHMTLLGFENMMLTHGLKCRGRIHGITESDAETSGIENYNYANFTLEQWMEYGLLWRKKQINLYLEKHQPDKFVVLDDLNLEVKNLVLCDRTKGFTKSKLRKALRILS